MSSTGMRRIHQRSLFFARNYSRSRSIFVVPTIQHHHSYPLYRNHSSRQFSNDHDKIQTHDPLNESFRPKFREPNFDNSDFLRAAVDAGREGTMSVDDFIRMDARTVFGTYGDATIQRVIEIQSLIRTSKDRQNLKEIRYANIGNKTFIGSTKIRSIQFTIEGGYVAYKMLQDEREYGGSGAIMTVILAGAGIILIKYLNNMK